MKKISILTILAAMLTFSSCEDDPILGCTDSLATNYNALADEDDNCIYFSDLIIGIWNGVSLTYTAQLSTEMMELYQMMDTDEFEDEFDIEQPTTDAGWDLFFETAFSENESLEGTIFEFDETNFSITEDGVVTYNNIYNFTSLTGFDYGEISEGVQPYEILACTETDLILRTVGYDEDEDLYYTMTGTFSR